MNVYWKHPTSNAERRTLNVFCGSRLCFRVCDMIGRVCFVRHSPRPGANDEQSRRLWNQYPGLRLLRILSLGCHLTPFQGLEMVRLKINDSIQRRSL